MSLYPITDEVLARIDNNFQYHAPQDGQTEKY